jgi:hypothetical protein
MKALPLSLLVFSSFLLFPTDSCQGGIRSPGKYSGVVVFDRWDGCMLYSGISVMYVSESIKEQLRPYAGRSIQIDATDVFQPMNPGDGLIKALKVLGPVPEGRRNWVHLEGLDLKCIPRVNDDGKPVIRIMITNRGDNPIKIFSGELAPTLLARGKAFKFTPYDGPSYAMITRQSFEIGGDEPRWQGRHWSIGEKNALPHDFMLEPGKRKDIDFVLELPDGEYDFLCGYGGQGGKGISSLLVGIDIVKEKTHIVRQRSAMRPETRRTRWQPTSGLLNTRAVVKGHESPAKYRIYSMDLEVKNNSGHSVELHFDPEDLQVEIRDSDGKVVKESYSPRSGPVPIHHKTTISPGSYTGITTYRGGIGLARRGALLGIGNQDWVLPPGTYTLEGKVSLAVVYGQVLDPLLPNQEHLAKDLVVGESHGVKLKIPKLTFVVQE